MSNKLQKLEDCLNQVFSNQLQSCVIENGEITIEVAPADLLQVATQLRDNDALGFEMLIDLCGVDYIDYGDTEWTTEDSSREGFSRAVDAATHGYLRFGDDLSHPEQSRSRFAAVYHLLSIKHNWRLRLRCYAENDAMPVVPSVIDIWNAANWFEREAFDLLGIHFQGHPDLRRILTDYGFVGHPFRKDFPLSGHVEMRYDPTQQRVIYQPVSIEPRVLVPRVIRPQKQDEEQPQQDAADA